MILVLSGGNNESHEAAELLERSEIPYLCVFSTFAEAGNYGKGNVIVSRLSEKDTEEIFAKEAVSGVLDIAAEGYETQSAAVMSVCRKREIPYIKFLNITINECINEHIKIVCSYGKIADCINSTLGHILFYAAPATVSAIVKNVPDTSNLYSIIPRGIGFDVERALEFRLPLVNILEFDSVDGEESVCAAIEKIDAKMLICDGSSGLKDKISASEKYEIPIIVTHKLGIDFIKASCDMHETMKIIYGWIKSA